MIGANIHIYIKKDLLDPVAVHVCHGFTVSILHRLAPIMDCLTSARQRLAL